jgi:hypothetical protein
MKLYKITISVILMLCLVGVAYAAVNAVHATNWGSDGRHHATSVVGVGQNLKAPSMGKIIANASKSPKAASVTNAASAIPVVAGAVSFTSIPTTGNCVDNTKKIAVYMPTMTNPVLSETSGKVISTAITYDSLCTAMFFEYNPDYLSDSTIATKLTKANYDLLIVPMPEMSNASAIAINAYLSKGGSVWFLNDPSMLPNGSDAYDQRINILGSPTYSPYNFINGSSTITVNNSDDITSGLPASFNPIGTTEKWSYFRALTNSGKISGFNYNVLMSNGNCAMLIKYENQITGARAIYSNTNMFVSGGDCSYFNAQTATKLFLQTKAWLLKLGANKNGIEITYPKSDKQFTITVDDEEAAAWELTNMDAMFNMEKTHGLTPNAVNTLFIIPDQNTTASELTYYAQNGDTHTLHPHVGPVWDNSQSVAKYQTAITNDTAIINKLMNVTDYGFTSWRFPMTTFCTNSMQAVSNSNFVIESSSGNCTDGISFGDRDVNNLLFPKQMLISSVKSNLIEMELLADFDICASSGTDFYNQNNVYMPYLQNGNFPMNFVVGCHYQGAGTNPDLVAALAQIIDASKSTGTSYANFNTLATYLTNVKGANIKAVNSGSSTTVTVVVPNTKQINDFTIKVTNMNTVSAKCDGISIPSSGVSHDGNVWYVTNTIGAGTHTFVITA